MMPIKYYQLIALLLTFGSCDGCRNKYTNKNSNTVNQEPEGNKPVPEDVIEEVTKEPPQQESPTQVDEATKDAIATVSFFIPIEV